MSLRRGSSSSNTALRSRKLHRRHLHWHHHHHHAAHEPNFWEHEFEADFQEPLPPVWRCTLFGEEPDHAGRPTVDPVCGLVLASFGEKAWNGRCRATAIEQNKWFDEFDDGNGKLTFDEVQRAVNRNPEAVRKLPAALHGLLIDNLVKAAFEGKFDKDNSGDMNKEEWNEFLDQLETFYLQYRRMLSFQCERAFYGRGWTYYLDEDSESDESEVASDEEEEPVDPAEFEVYLLRKIGDMAPATERKWQQWGLDKDCQNGWILPPGWWEDFVYYSANHHPLHGIISCDPDHRLNSMERVFMELATLGFLFIAEDLKARLRREDEGGNLDDNDLVKHSLSALISLAGIFVYYVMYLLFTCPKLGFVDRSRASEEEARRAERCDSIGSGIGYTLMAFLGVAMLINLPMLQKRWRPVLWSRLQGYAFTLVFFFLLPFNPFFAWGNNSSDPENFDKFCIGDWLGIGQWRIEKQRFQGQCQRLKENNLEDLALTSGLSPHASLRKGRTFRWDATRTARPRDMEANRGLRRPRNRGRRRELRPPPPGAPAPAAREPRPPPPRPPRARQGSSLSSGLSLAEWGDVFSNADAAWRVYVSGSGHGGRKPASATA